MLVIPNTNRTRVRGRYGDVVTVRCQPGFVNQEGPYLHALCLSDATWNITSKCEGGHSTNHNYC